MLIAVVKILALSMTILSSIALIVAMDWRWLFTWLGIQYAGGFILIALNWPISLALVKLVAGWMATAMLAMTLANQSSADMIGYEWLKSSFEKMPMQRPYQVFRLILCLLISLITLSIFPGLMNYLPGMDSEQAIGALFLILMGMVQLCLSTQTIRVVIGLLTVLAGFEIAYAIIETSTLLTGLLAGINLGIALVGVYLLSGTKGEFS